MHHDLFSVALDNAKIAVFPQYILADFTENRRYSAHLRGEFLGRNLLKYTIEWRKRTNRNF